MPTVVEFKCSGWDIMFRRQNYVLLSLISKKTGSSIFRSEMQPIAAILVGYTRDSLFLWWSLLVISTSQLLLTGFKSRVNIFGRPEASPSNWVQHLNPKPTECSIHSLILRSAKCPSFGAYCHNLSVFKYCLSPKFSNFFVIRMAFVLLINVVLKRAWHQSKQNEIVYKYSRCWR